MIRAAVAALLLLAPGHAVAQPADLERAVRDRVVPYVEMDHFAGSLLIARGDEVVVHEAFGLADRALGVPFETDTRFRVGSITKDFTAALILDLEEEGALSRDDPLARFLPRFPRADRITLDHLLTHTHGIPDWRRLPDAEALGATGTTLEAAVEALAGLEPEFEPGARRRYGSSGHLVLTRVIEIVTGRSYADALRSRILEPLGLDDTGSLEGLEIVPRLAASYVPTGRPPWLRLPDPDHPAITAGSASVYSTAMDLFRWSRSEVARDLGWGEAGWNGRRYRWTSGLTDGFVVRIRVFPEEDLSFVLASNVSTPVFRVVLDDLSGLMLDEPPPPPSVWSPVELGPADRASFAGRWSCGEEFAFAIRATVEGLVFEVDDARFPLVPRSETSVHLPTDYATIDFREGGPDGFGRARYDGGFTTTCERASPGDEASAGVSPGEVTGPRIARARAFRARLAAGDYEGARAMMAPEPRRWWETREGRGNPWTVGPGTGPWAAWDDHFESESEVVGWRETEESATAVVHETNDYFRLLERGRVTNEVTYFFDDEGRIEGLLIRAVGERPPGRTAEFLAWAEANAPDEIAALMPDGEIDPSGDHPERFRRLLERWREAAGSPPIE